MCPRRLRCEVSFSRIFELPNCVHESLQCLFGDSQVSVKTCALLLSSHHNFLLVEGLHLRVFRNFGLSGIKYESFVTILITGLLVLARCP